MSTIRILATGFLMAGILLLGSCSRKDMAKGENVVLNTVSYVESTDDIINPERGFFQYAEVHASDYIPLDLSLLKSYRSSRKIDNALYSVACSLVYVEYVLDSFTNSPMTAEFLSNLNKDCATARAAGVKLIPRFIYTNTTHTGNCPSQSICPPYGDAPKSVILTHIGQLKSYLQQNEDVIACMQLGFIGIYGENYYTDYFGDASDNGQGKLTDENWEDRIEVLKALLAALPADRMVQVRIPQLKERYVYGISANVISPALTAEEAFNGTDKARIGFHNDCFLSGVNDEGTYVDYGNSSSPQRDATSALRSFEMCDSQFTVVGGETCDDTYSPQNDCGPIGVAQQEFEKFHYSFLNAVYNLDVNNDWVTGGCMAEIKNRLGYRLVLKSATFPSVAEKGGVLNVTMHIENVGYASPFNDRPVQLILRNRTTGGIVAVNFNTDIRRWFTGTVMLTDQLTLPANLSPGIYDLLLNLPDKFQSISNRPEYSIRMANENMWEPATGYNSLNASITIR